MKHLLLNILLICLSISLNAQIEKKTIKKIDFSNLTNSKELKIIDENVIKKDIELQKTYNITSPKSFSGLNYKTKIDIENFGTLNPIKMEFGVAPTVNKYYIKPKPIKLEVYPQRPTDGEKMIFHDVNLGEFITKSKFFYYSLADSSAIDGDMINIKINGEVEHYDFYIGSRLRAYKINLNLGFNPIEITGINNGSSGPITGYLVITDDTGEEIFREPFVVSAGFKVKALVIRKE